MDYQFPQQLFPSFYNCGPPDSVLKHSAGNWGSYDRVRPEMQNFFMDHCQDAFGCMSHILGEHFNFKQGVKERYRRDSVHMWKTKNYLDMFKLKICQQSYTSRSLNMYSALLSDVVHAIPPDLLGTLLYEELTEQRDRLLFSEGVTGGAMAFVPFSQSDSGSQRGCLLYPGNKGLNCLKVCQELRGESSTFQLPEEEESLLSLLYQWVSSLSDMRPTMVVSSANFTMVFVEWNGRTVTGEESEEGWAEHAALTSDFHGVELQHRGGSSCVDASSSDPFSFQLKGPVRQISSASLFNNCCVAVRSDRMCGVWRFSEKNGPHLLQVVNTREVATCVNVSPHVLGEVLVASESGAAHLWTVGRGMQKVREEDQNLYFNAKSSWRWCEFSAHPRVMLFADRTGVELTDIRVSPALGHTLFRISNTSECRSGERLVLSRYLGDAHSFHHLITTQYSAYIMDERFPGPPMLKWDHMMQSPPMFCHLVPGSAVDGAQTTKILLGAHSSQEITLLQYSGGRAEACFSRGPLKTLLRPRDSLKYLPLQIPHRLDTATNRLSSPAAGLTCIQMKGGREADECICVLQLTEAGDIFYQILEPERLVNSQPPAAEDDPLPQQAAKKTQPTLRKATTSCGKTAEQLQPDSQLVISETLSDEDVIGPTQGSTAQRFVAETPQREQQTLSMYSDDSSEDSESAGKGQNLKQVRLQVLKGSSDNTEEPGGGEESGSCSFGHAAPFECQSPVKLSDGAIVTWKHWLQKLMQKSCKKKPRPRSLQHFTIKTVGLLQPSDNKKRNPSEEKRVQILRRDLRACMSKRSLLVHSSVSAPLRAPDVVPVPNVVDPEIWTDQLSHRLTISWQGVEAWRAWWEDQLGLNREEKVKALRRKRRREKEAKRAAGGRLELSRSFTSSTSYQSLLDNFSDSTGWSSVASQGAWSDTDGPLSQLAGECGAQRPTTPSSVQTDTPAPTLTATPRSVKDRQEDQQTPSSSRAFFLSQTPKPHSTPTNQRRNKRPAEDYLSSLFAPQDEPSQHDSYFLEEGNMGHPQPPPGASSSSQLRSSQLVSQRSLRVDLSQDASTWSGVSQSLFHSQSSQGRQGLWQASQASQPKKKSRMGF
ncbi:hypothetical protein L3Q82_012266 [Scortum barcoo]|uniref:Uncharacterized protein n=1 Tax=Scortum barcoo TaxID=214431 RepID=A0ACB8W4H4_9TELE|nr:hypothetical protein L3Q82_012266 [Scortum barcoo]